MGRTHKPPFSLLPGAAAPGKRPALLPCFGAAAPGRRTVDPFYLLSGHRSGQAGGQPAFFSSLSTAAPTGQPVGNRRVLLPLLPGAAAAQRSHRTRKNLKSSRDAVSGKSALPLPRRAAPPVPLPAAKAGSSLCRPHAAQGARFGESPLLEKRRTAIAAPNAPAQPRSVPALPQFFPAFPRGLARYEAPGRRQAPRRSCCPAVRSPAVPYRMDSDRQG